MSARPVLAAARGGLSGHRVQTAVIGLVLLVSTAAATLALGLLVDSNAPFDHAFAAQHGAHVTAAITASAATTKVPGVTAAAGPFPEVTVNAQITFTVPGGHGITQEPLTLVGRWSPGGPVDDLTLIAGRWAQRPGEVVWDGGQNGPPVSVGATITVPGSPDLTVVGAATSATGTAQAWVVPTEITELSGAHNVAQMLYRFTSAGTSAAVSKDIAALRAALPPGAVLGAQSYLTAKLRATASIAPWVPFIVAFGLIGLVMAVLIVVNVVSGAVVAGTRRIGVLKSVGFSPAQVVAGYVLQVAMPAAVGCLAGVVVGNLLSVPLLGQTATAYGVGALAVPVWVDVAVPLIMLGLAVVAALLPALRGGRLSAVQAIAIGRAPRAARGYAAHRLLGRAKRLPRPLTLGLAAPFARPARTVITLVAIGLGVVAVTFAAGLATSLDRVETDLSHARSEPVQVDLPGPGGMSVTKPGAPAPPPLPSLADQERTVTAALRAQPGTLRYVAEADDDISALGARMSLTGFDGDASWTGYALITGRWYQGNGQADVNTAFLTDTGTAVGDSYTIGHVTFTIAGEVFDPSGGTPKVLASLPTLSALDPGLAVGQYDVALKPGTAVQPYANTLGHALGLNYSVNARTDNDITFAAIVGLIATLTLLLAAVAGLGVLNTVVLQTRERVHDLGVFKAVGMTPRQTIAMVVCSVAGVGLLAGLIAIPAGVALQRYVLPVMAHAAQTDVPASVLNAYVPWELIALAVSGLLIAALGALAPAGWAARARTAFALRAE